MSQFHVVVLYKGDKLGMVGGMTLITPQKFLSLRPREKSYDVIALPAKDVIHH